MAVSIVDVEHVEYELVNVREHDVSRLYRRFPDGFWEKSYDDGYTGWFGVRSQDDADALEAAYQRYMADQEGAG